MTVNDNTPIAMMTLGQLKEALKSNEAQKTVEPKKVEYVKGLKGIRELFGVSHVTAHKYKETILKDAVIQNGRVILVDKNKAFKLFKEKGEAI